MLQLLLSGVGKFLSLLTSCATGVQLLMQNQPIMMAVMEALHPGSSQQPFLALDSSGSK